MYEKLTETTYRIIFALLKKRWEKSGKDKWHCGNFVFEITEYKEYNTSYSLYYKKKILLRAGGVLLNFNYMLLNILHLYLKYQRTIIAQPEPSLVEILKEAEEQDG
jgi:hypothetical protein